MAMTMWWRERVGVDFFLAYGDGRMPRRRRAKARCGEKQTSACALNTSILRPLDDDGGDLATGDEERARARIGELFFTRLGSNL